MRVEGGGREGRNNLYNPSDDGYNSVKLSKLQCTASPGGMPDSPKKLARSPGPPPPPPLFLSAFFSAPLSFLLSFLPGMVRGALGERRGGGKKGWIK